MSGTHLNLYTPKQAHIGYFVPGVRLYSRDKSRFCADASHGEKVDKLFFVSWVGEPVEHSLLQLQVEVEVNSNGQDMCNLHPVGANE